jgi:hypothetical protein
MRHVFGVVGVAAALILLGVSAAMNWQFGYSLGKTPFDSQVFGAASIAADCMKALMPFFIFSAWRNRNYPQAAGASALWAVCIVYAMTSALGFAATNRSDTTSTRAVQAEKYEDLRTELIRITQQQAELPKHRPLGAIQSEIDALKQNFRWTSSQGCTNATIDESRELCKQIYTLSAEQDNAKKDEVFQTRADELRSKVAGMQSNGRGPVKVADPQAKIISDLSGIDISKIEMVMTILVTMLVELGSSLGLYVATSTWRIEAGRLPLPEQPKIVEIIRPAPPAPLEMPMPLPPQIHQLAPPSKSDIEVYFDTRIRQDDGASVTALALYDNYCDWCETMQRTPVGLPIFSRQLTDLGVQKAKIAGKIRYIGIRIGGYEEEEDGSDLAAVS